MSEKIDTLPVDKELPQLRIALSPDQMGEILQEKVFSKDNQFQVQSCEVNYVRYKPQTTCLVGYSVKLLDKPQNTTFDHWFYAKLYKDTNFILASGKLQKRVYSRFNGIPPVSFWEDLKLVLFSFPNDRILRPLKWLLDPHKFKRLLLPSFPQYSQGWRIQDHKTVIEPVRYKPERRCVLRCKLKFKEIDSEKEAKKKFFVRVYSDHTGKVVQELLENLKSSSLANDRKVNVPSVLGYNEQLKVLIMSKVSGKELLELVGQSKMEEALEKTALMLANLHNLKVETQRKWSLLEELEAIKKQSELISSILPELNGKIKDLISKLENRTAPLNFSSSNLLHGDFYYGQVLVDQDQIWFLDLDESTIGDPLLDAGNFVAHLQYQSLRSPEYAWNDYIELFQKAYFQASPECFKPQKLSWFKAYCLMRLAIWPFRTLKSNWQKMVEKIIDLADRELENVA